MANQNNNNANDHGILTSPEENNEEVVHPPKTPLEMVREQQARTQNQEVQEKRVDATAEVPGHSIPSAIRHHPQRKMG